MPSAAPDRIRLMGMPIDVVTEEQAVQRVVRGGGGVAVTPNLDHLRQYCLSEAVQCFYHSAELVPADGMPLVWASRIMGTPLPERVPGSDMIWSLSKAAADRGMPVFLVGGNPGTADAAAQVLSQRFSGLRIAGTACPAFDLERDSVEIETIAGALTDSGAAIVFVGLPLLKQIALIEALRARCPRTWFLGVGISFSLVSGEVARAPRWMQRLGIEWVARLFQEPRRLARRYLVEGVPFALRLLGTAVLVRLKLS